MNTIENNKLIAEFLGYKEQKDPTERWFGRFFIPTKGWYKENELAFSHDWNWLMEVVDKIEKIVIENDNSFNVTIGATIYCVIQDSNGECYEMHYNGKTKIEAVYNACLEFIKWYNLDRNILG